MPSSLTTRYLPHLSTFGALAVLGLAGCQGSSLPSEPQAAVGAGPNPVVAQLTFPWKAATPMPTGRLGLVTATVNGTVYAIGGYSSEVGGPIRTVEAFNPAGNVNVSWKTKQKLPGARVSPSGAAVINGKIYVPGGRNANNVVTKSLYVYNPATDTWATKAEMPVASAYGAAAAINGKLYVFTPYYAGKGPFLHRYDPSTNTWTKRATPLHPHAWPAAGVIDGKFYVAGGYYGGLATADLDVYNPGANTWTTKKSMPAARGYMAGRVLDGKLYVLGGSAGGAVLAKVERYDPGNNTWATVVSMPTARIHLAAAVADGVLYALGGLGAPNSPTANEAYLP
jgi:N-acetylneuraminic acid mutarotase